eukprot:2317633-Karenia_brevis.AAC.1
MVRSYTTASPYQLFVEGASDHAILKMDISRVACVRQAEQPLPSWLTASPEFQRLLSKAINSCQGMATLPACVQLPAFKELMRDTARIT